MMLVNKDGLSISLKSASSNEDWRNFIHKLIGLLQSESILQEKKKSCGVTELYTNC